MRLFNVVFSFLFLVSSLTFAQATYTVGSTEYYYNDYYSTTDKPKVKRSYSNKMEFLRSQGYNSLPEGYEVDHIIPLSEGGSDTPYNMQLLTIRQHKAKTARERSRTTTSIPTFNTNSSFSAPVLYAPTSTNFSTSIPELNSNSSSSRTIYTGSRGGRYYINKNGNKTYVKK
jgi:hypothetical protein